MNWLAALRRKRRSGGPPDRLFRRALRNLIAGDLEGVERDLAAVTRETTTEVEAYLGLAELYRRRGEIGRAIKLHQNLALREDLDEDQQIAVLCGLGRDFEAGGFVPRAVASFDSVLEKDPRHSTAMAGLVRLLPLIGESERALVLLRRLAKQRGERARTDEAALLIEIARARHEEGRDDVARRSLKRAIRADAGAIDAHLLMAEIDLASGHPKKAMNHWVLALDAAPDRAPALLPLMEMNWAEGGGRRGDWLDFLQEQARGHADEPSLVDALARALVERERVDEGVDVLQAGLLRWPGHMGLRMRLGRALLEGGCYDDALLAFESMLDQLEKAAGEDA